MKKQKVVFLGGTVGENHWREEIVIPELLKRGVRPEQLFNPVVADWDTKAQEREDVAKRDADYLLFVIASPDPTHPDTVSVYSLVEMVMSMYDDPQRTVVLLDMAGMQGHIVKALRKAARDLSNRHPSVPVYTDYQSLLDWFVAALQ